jgi:hypothetical protein
MIVGRGHLVALLMCKLQLHVLVLKAVLVQYRGRQPTKTMAGHAAFVTQTV